MEIWNGECVRLGVCNTSIAENKHLRLHDGDLLCDGSSGDGAAGTKWRWFQKRHGVVQLRSNRRNAFIRIRTTDNGKTYIVDADGGGGRFCDFQVHELGRNSVALESVKYPRIFLGTIDPSDEGNYRIIACTADVPFGNEVTFRISYVRKTQLDKRYPPRPPYFYAALSKLVYEKQVTPLMPVYGALGVTRLDSKNSSDCKCYLFEHISGERIVAFRGTEVLGDYAHWFDVIKNRGVPSGIKDALQEWNHRKPIHVLCGHSLGGYWATKAKSGWSWVHRITFNTARPEGNRMQPSGGVLNIRSEGDPLTSLDSQKHRKCATVDSSVGHKHGILCILLGLCHSAEYPYKTKTWEDVFKRDRCEPRTRQAKL